MVSVIRPERVALYHTDDRIRAAIQINVLPYNLRIAAVALLPKAVTEDDYLRPVQKSFFIDECAAEHRLNAEKRKQVCGNRLALNVGGFVSVR